MFRCKLLFPLKITQYLSYYQFKQIQIQHYSAILKTSQGLFWVQTV